MPHEDCLHCVEKSREALKLLMSHTNEQRRDLEKRIAENYMVTVLPLIEHLKSMNLPPSQAYLLETLEFNLRHINSVFRIQVTTSATRLSDREIEICQLIRAGKDSRQIADALGLKLQTVMVHRKHIRRKLGLRNKSVRLSVFLQRSLDTMY
jgi:DNA-binding CsgD family transcriptional regulator